MSRLEMQGQKEEGGEFVHHATFMSGEGTGPITNFNRFPRQIRFYII